MVKIKPFLPPLIIELLEQPHLLQQALRLASGPVHLLVPEIMSQNISAFKQILASLGFKSTIFFAHKPTKSPVFVRLAGKNGLGIDVASRGELVSALAAGLRGEQIECTGLKNRDYLLLSCQHNCLISVDSPSELELLLEIGNRLAQPNVRILLRVNDLNAGDRVIRRKVSKFGFRREDISTAFETIKKSTFLQLTGFHVHSEVQAVDLRAEFIWDILELMRQAHSAGLRPEIINIGGGWRGRELGDYQQWSRFVLELEECLMHNRPVPVWRNYAYGMWLNQHGRISGRERAENVFVDQGFESIIPAIFASTNSQGYSLEQIISESLFTVIFEPGNALLNGCGISLMQVIGTKSVPGEDLLILLDGNSLNLSRENRDFLSDPILVSCASNEAAVEECSGYLIGNTCAESDLIMKRKVTFDRKPLPGDIICFVNTARYYADFYDTNPHLHPLGSKLCACKSNGNWMLLAEDKYNPYFTE